jgi:hypothetical protein
MWNIGSLAPCKTAGFPASQLASQPESHQESQTICLPACMLASQRAGGTASQIDFSAACKVSVMSA